MDKEKASQHMTNVFDLAAGAIEGFGIVYDGLEKSGIMLGSSISNNTVLIVRHRLAYIKYSIVITYIYVIVNL